MSLHSSHVTHWSHLLLGRICGATSTLPQQQRKSKDNKWSTQFWLCDSFLCDICSYNQNFCQTAVTKIHMLIVSMATINLSSSSQSIKLSRTCRLFFLHGKENFYKRYLRAKKKKTKVHKQRKNKASGKLSLSNYFEISERAEQSIQQKLKSNLETNYKDRAWSNTRAGKDPIDRYGRMGRRLNKRHVKTGIQVEVETYPLLFTEHIQFFFFFWVLVSFLYKMTTKALKVVIRCDRLVVTGGYFACHPKCVMGWNVISSLCRLMNDMTSLIRSVK